MFPRSYFPAGMFPDLYFPPFVSAGTAAPIALPGASKTDICNLALLRMGTTIKLTNVDTDTTTDAITCRSIFDIEEQWVLRDFPWNFATKYVALANGVFGPNPDWKWSYPWPFDAVKVRRIVTTDGRMNPNPPAFRIGQDADGNRVVFTDVLAGSIEYTAQVQKLDATGADITQYYDPMFVSMFAWRLAAMLVIPLGRVPEMAKVCLDSYASEKAAAEKVNGLEGQKDTVESEDPIVKEVVNMALLRIGITNDTEDKSAAELMAQARLTNLAFIEERDFVLRDFPWTWARREATPAALAGSPAVPVTREWVYAYPYPDDAIAIRRLIRQCDLRDYRLQRMAPLIGQQPWPVEYRVGGGIDMVLNQRGGWHETPAPLNTFGTEFRLAQMPIDGTELIFLGEALLTRGVDYALHGQLLILAAPAAASLQAFYWIAATAAATEVPVFRERPDGIIDNDNTTFTLSASPVVGSEMVFLNEELQQPDVHYAISGQTITMMVPPIDSDRLRAFYWTTGVPGGTTEVQSVQAMLDASIEFRLPSEPIAGSEMVFLNESLQERDVHYTIAGGAISWIVPIENGTPFRAIWTAKAQAPGTAVYCNETGVTIEYTARVIDPARWDSMFRSMLACKLGAKLAPSRIKDPKLAEARAQSAMQYYLMEKTQAQTANANEGQYKQPADAEWIAGR